MATAGKHLGTRRLSAVPAGRSRRPRLVLFYSRESGPCRRTDGYVAQVLQRRANHETFALERVEAAERPDLHLRFGIETVPTLIVIEGNRVRGRLADPSGCAAIERFLTPWLR
jgi:thioredoxin-like negative regulator of GroEL